MILKIFAVLMALGLISCGQTGSSGGSSSSDGDSPVKSSSVTLRISGLTVTTAGAGSVSAAVAPAYIRSVRVTVSAPDMDTVVAEALLSDPLGVEISLDIPTGSGRLFKVEALDAAGLPIFAGQTYADIGTTAVTLDVTLVDLIEQMINSFAQTISSKGDALAPADVDGYFSLDYGINNGKTREQEIADLIPDTGVTFVQKPTMAGVTNLVEKTVTSFGDYLLNPTLNYDDGSYTRDSVIVTYEDGVWKFKGNDFRSSAYLSAFNGMKTDIADTVTYAGGIMVKVVASINTGISKAVITGPGLPAAGATLLQDPATGKFKFTGLNGDEFYPMSDATISTMPATNANYTISMYNYAGTLIESRIEIIPARPHMTSELDPTYFASLIGVSHNIYSLPLGYDIFIDYAKPGAYSAANLTVLLRYKTTTGYEYLYRRSPLLTDSFTDILTQLGYYESPVNGNIVIKTMDPGFRDMFYSWDLG